MRKFTALILLASFVIAQYAKQVSYLECRVSNYFKVPAEKCDCEKVLKESKGPADQWPLPLSHNHMHIDESYFPPASSCRATHFGDNCIAYMTNSNSMLPDGITCQPDHPPQVH